MQPNVSVVVHRDVAPLGTIIYLEELDGVMTPGSEEPHSGCVRVDDGGAISPTGIRMFAYIDHPQCLGVL